MRVMDVSTLVLASVIWGAIAAVLLMNLLLRRHGVRLLFAGLLMAATGSVINAITLALRVTHQARLVADGAALLLGSAGFVIVIIVGARLAAQRRTPPTPSAQTPSAETASLLAHDHPDLSTSATEGPQ